MLDFLGTLERTHRCGELRGEDAGADVVVMGWVNRRRDHGNLIFLDVRDRSGIVQVVLDKEVDALSHAKGEVVRPEYVIAVSGRVRRRGPGLENPKMETGEIEVVATELKVLNDAKTPPFSPAEDAIQNEEVRLKYRYLDLRRPEMQANLMTRHKVTLAIREYLAREGFLEIETPFMTRSTPEGARDYLVPSRVHAGSFYALPQSPQIFKQILMISGLDRYFQVARCFRDEDLRADRQPEFTQIDLEMSFPQQDTVFAVVEGFLKAAFSAAGKEIASPFPRMTYDEAIRLYGIDKPDLRLPPMIEVQSAFSAAELDTLKIDGAYPVMAIRIPKVGDLSRKELEEARTTFPGWPADRLIELALVDDFKRLQKGFPAAVEKIRKLVGAETDDFLVLAGVRAREAALEIESVPVTDADGRETAGHRSRRELMLKGAGAVRLALAQKFASRHKAFDKKGDSDDYKFLWVTDFPFFEWDEEKREWTFAHHPFTSPHEEDLKAGRLTSDPGAVRARAYDVVLNGTELGSGSIRIHRQDVQAEIFRALGMTDEEAKQRFGFFLDALQYGTPPHGGIALGLDRIAMILAGAQSLREVIAFPKTAKAIDLMVDAPMPVSDLQLRDLHIRTVLKS